MQYTHSCSTTHADSGQCIVKPRAKGKRITARGACGVPGQASSGAAAPWLASLLLEAAAVVCRVKPPVAPPRRGWPPCCSRRRLRCAGPSL
eukprot:scaffold40631_cov71-Phaeocystis_antarctica.AAC.2